MQIVCQRAQRQGGDRSGCAPRPAGQGLLPGPVGRQGAEEQQQRRRDIGNVIAVPEISLEDRLPEGQAAAEELQDQEQEQGRRRAEDQPPQTPVCDAAADRHGPEQEQDPAEPLGEALAQVPMVGQHPQRAAQQERAGKYGHRPPQAPIVHTFVLPSRF